MGNGIAEQRFNYIFYVDFVGALSEERCQNALRHLQVRIIYGCAALCQITAEKKSPAKVDTYSNLEILELEK